VVCVLGESEWVQPLASAAVVLGTAQRSAARNNKKLVHNEICLKKLKLGSFPSFDF